MSICNASPQLCATTEKIVSFIIQQDSRVVIMLIACSTILTVCWSIYLYCLSRRQYNHASFWKDQFSNICCSFQKTIERNALLQEKIRYLRKQVSFLRKDLQKDLSDIRLTDELREEIANDFNRIIATLNVHNEPTLLELIKLGKKLEIEIDTDHSKIARIGMPGLSPEPEIRRQPYRSAAPTRFNVSEDEDDSDDSDYQPKD